MNDEFEKIPELNIWSILWELIMVLGGCMWGVLFIGYVTNLIPVDKIQISSALLLSCILTFCLILNNKKEKWYANKIKNLISLNLWSARRLHTLNKITAYDELEKITGNKYERL